MATRLTAVSLALEQIAAQLVERDRAWALVGGLAVSARAEPRTTRDVDVAIASADDRDAENLVGELRSFGYEIEALLEDVATHRIATVRLRPRSGPSKRVLVDLLFASSGIEAEIAARADDLAIIPGLTVPVASIGHLMAMKTLARDDRQRPQDWDDLRALLGRASKDDIEEARAAVSLIEERGFSRGRDLRSLLELAVAESATGDQRS